jgi:hypothetical protein
MFYLHVHMPYDKQCRWIGVEYGAYIIVNSALHAEAFHMRDVEQTRQYTLRVFPGCTCFPIECSSNKIIPENMRQLMNCA